MEKAQETNADVIRRMTDEQLFSFLDKFQLGDVDYSITFCDLCKKEGNALELDCDGCLKHWLSQPSNDIFGLCGNFYEGEFER